MLERNNRLQSEGKRVINRIILVIGSVTARQCRIVRLSVLEQGHHPKAVRVSAEEFFLDDDKLLERYATLKQLQCNEKLRSNDTAESAREQAKLMKGLANQHLASFGPAVALIMDQDTWTNWDRLHWMEDAIENQAEYIHRWVVLATGQAEYVG